MRPREAEKVVALLDLFSRAPEAGQDKMEWEEFPDSQDS